MFLTDKNILVLKEVDSTNNYAKQLVGQGVENGTVVLAHFQQTGRGQVGNYWESEAGKNLLMSLILYPQFLDAGKQFAISKAISLALVKCLEAKTGDVSIKWPNDIYVGNKKIAGILIENTIKGRTLDSSVVGVGLNLNQEVFLSNAPNPVSLFQLTGNDYDVNEVLHDLLIHFQSFLSILENGDLDVIDHAYLEKMYRIGEWNPYRKDGNTFDARIVGIGEFGQLQLESRTGEIMEFMFKEVEFVI